MTDKPFSVDNIEAPKEVTVRLTRATDSEIQLQMTFHPQKSPGWRDGKIKLGLSGTHLREVIVPFKAMVEGVLDTDPNFLNFGLVSPKQTKVLAFRIVNRSGKPIKLRLVSQPLFIETRSHQPQQDPMAGAIESSTKSLTFTSAKR